jgi:hypothetical protein
MGQLLDGLEATTMSSYRYYRSMLGLYPRLAIAICSLLVVLMLEEWEPGDEIIWHCSICGRDMNGTYPDDMDKHPYCEANDKGKGHQRIKMTANARE